MRNKNAFIQAVLIITGTLVLLFVWKLLYTQNVYADQSQTPNSVDLPQILLGVIGVLMVVIGLISYIKHGNQRLRIITIAGILALLAIAHFVPLYSKSGYSGNTAVGLCRGYDGPVNEYHRVIPEGLHDFNQSKKYFTPAITDGDKCVMPIVLRLYVL